MTLLPAVIADLILCFSKYKFCERDYFIKAKFEMNIVRQATTLPMAL